MPICPDVVIPTKYYNEAKSSNITRLKCEKKKYVKGGLGLSEPVGVNILGKWFTVNINVQFKIS